MDFLRVFDEFLWILCMDFRDGFGIVYGFYMHFDVDV